jgi:phosphoketolase
MPLPDMQDPNVQVDWAYWHNSHGMDATRFVELFTADKPVVFAFHGYQRRSMR